MQPDKGIIAAISWLSTSAHRLVGVLPVHAAPTAGPRHLGGGGAGGGKRAGRKPQALCMQFERCAFHRLHGFHRLYGFHWLYIQCKTCKYKSQRQHHQCCSREAQQRQDTLEACDMELAAAVELQRTERGPHSDGPARNICPSAIKALLLHRLQVQAQTCDKGECTACSRQPRGSIS